jgi:hypothetical protein
MPMSRLPIRLANATSVSSSNPRLHFGRLALLELQNLHHAAITLCPRRYVRSVPCSP